MLKSADTVYQPETIPLVKINCLSLKLSVQTSYELEFSRNDNL